MESLKNFQKSQKKKSTIEQPPTDQIIDTEIEGMDQMQESVQTVTMPTSEVYQEYLDFKTDQIINSF